MGEVVNLRAVRKRAARRQQAQRAAQNRVVHGDWSGQVRARVLIWTKGHWSHGGFSLAGPRIGGEIATRPGW